MAEEQKLITLAHGNGGELSQRLIQDVFVKIFANPLLAGLGDSARLFTGSEEIAFTTDSFVVKPLFFPGGDIGKLAVCGTVNDLAVTGVSPRFLSCSMIIEEGFPLQQLEKITRSLQKTAESCGVTVVTGDTKVVEKGMADGLFINTAGIGVVDNPQVDLSLKRVVPGDKVIINGTIGDHGLAVLTAREEFPVATGISSDCAPLNDLISGLFRAVSPGEIRFLRDPTRGGIGTTLNEFVAHRDFGICIAEEAVPVNSGVRIISEMTGFDPLYIANEGKVLIITSAVTAEAVLAFLKDHPLGKESRIIGEVTLENRGQVILRSCIGGLRIVDLLVGDMLPRIC